MNKLIKVALVALIGAFGLNAQAQDMGITVKGGLNFNSVSLSGKNIDAEDKKGLESKFNGHFGVFYEAPITNILFVETGLLFDTRGFKGVTNNEYYSSETSMSLYALSLPVVAKGKFELADEMKLFAQAGLFADYFLFGNMQAKSTDKTSNQTETRSADVKFGKDEDSAFALPSRFNFGLNFGGGVEFKKVVLSLEYNLGLKDLNENENENRNIKLNSFKVGVGYKF